MIQPLQVRAFPIVSDVVTGQACRVAIRSPATTGTWHAAACTLDTLFDAVIKVADEALSDAKTTGRNRIVSFRTSS
ncbi:hypothetical protein BUPH_08234 (plasmid) [Paraburkholderia phenoliruptrix BR3459a]|uniref:Uncharacterized protein n=1 Tax=Paraburkholderia phenoliruptrix BR3459a TaxID=1229205 RepID=K0E0Q8_9BURK|nr:hypothetical protein BUPH_08234 [Paraburkholderia phenoliruptrix BR3459a]